MRYTVFSIDDRRKHYTDKIETALSPWDRVYNDCVNGYDQQQLDNAVQKYAHVSIHRPMLVGQLGIWYTVLNAIEGIEDEPLVTFEDDALLSDNFVNRFDEVWTLVPADCDFFSLFVPADWKDNYYYGSILDADGYYLSSRMGYTGGNPTYSTGHREVKRAYQKYGGVSMVYTPQGARKIESLLRETGITDQYDDYLYRQSRLGNLNGYTVAPDVRDLVYITGTEISIVQESPLYDRVKP